jgi:hypothetical protein
MNYRATPGENKPHISSMLHIVRHVDILTIIPSLPNKFCNPVSKLCFLQWSDWMQDYGVQLSP